MNTRTLAIRFSVYIILALYIAADLYWFDGPLRQTVDRLSAGSEEEIQQAREDKIAAIIYGEGITLAQLDLRVLQHLRRRGKTIDYCTPDRLYQLRLILLQELILKRVVEGKLRLRDEGKISEKDVVAVVAETKDQFNTPEQSAAAIAAAGMTEESLGDYYRQWLAERVYVDRLVAGNEDRMPLEDHIQAYYDKNEDLFIVPERYNIRQLFLSTLNKDAAVVGDKIAEIHLKIASGQTSFAQMVSENSEDPATKDIGGNIGWVAVDRLPGAIPGDALANLNPGEMSPPVQSRIGWHLFDLVEKRPARKLGLEEVRGIIREHLDHQQRVRYADALKRVLENDAEARVVFETLVEPFSLERPDPESTAAQ